MDYTKKLTETAMKTIRGLDMLPKTGGSVLCGFSGGSDSVCLMHFLLKLREETGVELLALHVNHGIRGAEASRDQDFCEAFCEKYGVAFIASRLDIPARVKETGETLEEAARNARYAEFERVCVENGINTLATAHNARDNAETVVFSLIRGASVHGIAGIPPVRELGNIKVIRPLLCCPKEWILAYDAENSLDYVTDSTNSDISYTRNFIRAEILPLFAKINPSYESSISDFSALARLDDDFMAKRTRELTKTLFIDKIPTGFDCKTPESVSNGSAPSTITADEIPDSLLSRALILRFSDFSDKTLENVHVAAMLEAVRKGRGSVSLPGLMKFSVENGAFKFSPDDRSPAKPQAECLFDLPLKPGMNAAEGSQFSVYAVFGPLDDIIRKDIKQQINIYKLFIHAFASSDKIIGKIKFRSRRAGDRITVLGTRKDVRRLMNEKKIPPELRSSVPVFYDAEGIVCVGGFAVCDRIFVSEKDRDTADFHLFILGGGSDRDKERYVEDDAAF